MDYDEFIATFAYNKIADLSATSVALALSAISLIQLRENWSDDGNPLNDTQWNYIDSIIGIGTLELMSSLVGIIFPSVMSSVSAFKFLPCDGGTYNKADYPLLYDAIDPIYIISGSQFVTPDYRDRSLVGTGNNYSLDDSGGVDSVVLTIDEIPNHSHSYNRPIQGIDVEGAGVPDPTAVGLPYIPTQTSLVGGGNSHDNKSPYRAVNWIIVAG